MMFVRFAGLGVALSVRVRVSDTCDILEEVFRVLRPYGGCT